MSICNKCGESVDWSNPNIHYGGHTCNPNNIKPEVITKNIPIQEQQVKLTWHDVFDGYKLIPENFNSVISYLKCTSYRYLAFNGMVYSVRDLEMNTPICSEEEL